MRLLTFLATAVLAASANARSSIFGKGIDVAPFSEELKVPGENPLQHCQDPKDDILTLESVDLDPNPPLPGKTLTITATGTLSQNVTKGSKIHLQVKYGLITIIKQTADLCDTVKNVDLECPIEEGKTTLTKEVDLPKQIPNGKYSVVANAETEEEERITCLQATIEFKKGGGDDDKMIHQGL